jgi:gliding motility-associated lipoprotein GldK
MGLVKQGADGNEYLDWPKVKAIKWDDKATLEKIDAMIVTPDNRIFGKKEIDASKMIYQSETFDYAAAAANRDPNVPRSAFIVKKNIPIYPDTLVWVRDFAYSYNEPMAKQYYSHPAFGNYPVVGVNWKQATAFCEWRTQYLNSYLTGKKRSNETDFRLPTEAQWEYAARGGRSQAPFPWGGPYLRNRKGCLLANFKPGRGNYPEDGGFYTVRADAYWPNDFGLYCMAGNVAEWTSSLYYEGGYNFQHDMNPDIRWNAKDQDAPRMKRKVVRGGSWKDVGYYLRVSTRSFEYMDTAKSYIGFRCVIDLPPSTGKKGRK